MPPKAAAKEDQPPASAFSEPSEPSENAPGRNPASQLTSDQEENPQLIAQKPGRQRADKNGGDVIGKEFKDAKSSEVDSYDYEGVLDTVKRKVAGVKGKL